MVYQLMEHNSKALQPDQNKSYKTFNNKKKVNFIRRTQMDARKLTPFLTVSPQISIEDVGIAASMGFRTMICNRPENESEDQPEMQGIIEACERQGMAWHFQPVISGKITDENVAEFGALLKEVQGPVFAFCRTGTRCTSLWALSESSHLDADTILETAKNAGYDLAGLRAKLEANHAAHNPTLKVAGRRHEIVIIGGGAGGQAVAASLLKRNADLDIAIIEPRSEHYYQPGWTMVGGGVFERAETIRPMADVMPKQARWIQSAVASFEPDQHQVILEDGESVGYRILVVAPGLSLNWDGIKGLKQTLGSNGVTSNYMVDLAPYTWELVQAMKSGKAIFTQPPMPIKCAGAPQKAMYLSCDHWYRNNVLNNINVEFCTSTPGLFGVADYVPALMEYIKKYKIELGLQTTLVEVDGISKTAHFKQTNAAGEVSDIEKKFDMLHVCPPQKAPAFIANSPLADAAGWVDISPETMQHLRYGDIFALGDAGNSPNAKTAAAVRKQAPAVAENIIMVLKGESPRAVYDGYGSCPLTVERGKIVLAEFGYGGKLLPSFPKWLIDGTKPSVMAWMLKEKLLPWLYFEVMLEGKEWLAKPNILPKSPTKLEALESSK